MKILLTCENYFPRLGGAEVHVYQLLNNLKKQNIEVSLITHEPGEHPDDKELDIIRISEKNTLFGLINAFFKIYQKSKDVQAIHSHYSYKLAMISGLVAKLRKKPFIITLHGMGILNPPRGSSLYKKFHSLCRWTSLKLATKIISTSDDLAQEAYLRVKKEKVEIITNGVDVDYFQNIDQQKLEELKNKYLPRRSQAKAGQGKKIILTVRRFNRKTGIHFMPYIISELNKKYQDFIYLVIGWGPLDQEIKKRVADLGLQDKIEFLGKIDNKQVPLYYHLADTVVFPSSAESTSISCIEAMATKTTVVASRVGGLVELIGEGEERGLFVKMFEWTHSNYDAPMDLPQETYQHVAEVLNSSLTKDQQQKTDQAFEYVKNSFDWSIITKKTINIYQQYGK